MFTIRNPRRVTKTVVPLSLVTLMAAGIVIEATPASAATITDGPGIMVDGHRFGAYMDHVNGHAYKTFCVTPNGTLTTGQLLRKGQPIKGLTPTKRYQLAYILETAKSDTNYEAAAEYAALNLVVGNDARQFKGWLRDAPFWVQSHAHTLVTDSMLFRGPYKVGLNYSKSAQVGQSGKATETVISGSGHPVPHMLVTFWGSNVTIGQSATTNAHGNATVGYLRTQLGNPKLHALVHNTPPIDFLSSYRKGYDQQELLARLPGGTASSVTSFSAFPNTPSYSWNCTNDCPGIPRDQATVTAVTSKFKQQWVEWQNGRVVKTIVFQAGQSGTRSVPGTSKDGAQVNFGVRYFEGKTWTAFYHFGHTYMVKCKKPPFIIPMMVCDCQQVKVDFQTVGANPYTVNEYIIINKQVVATVKPGQVGHYPVTFARGSTVSYTYQGAVANGDGTTNVGPSLTLSQP